MSLCINYCKQTRCFNGPDGDIGGTALSIIKRIIWRTSEYCIINRLVNAEKRKKKKEIIAAIENHEIQIVIGTHALIQDDVFFDDLGLAIVDEQHRFGVKQRRTLRDKGMHPDVLFMTATPIPRTLAITAF